MSGDLREMRTPRHRAKCALYALFCIRAAILLRYAPLVYHLSSCSLMLLILVMLVAKSHSERLTFAL